MCKQFKVAEDVAYTVNRRHYYFFDYNATVCAVPKAGSSTWRVHVRRINGGPPANVSVEDDKRRQTFLQSGLRQVVASTVSSSTLIMSVRHPLTRLVSAYRNKYDDGKPMRGYNRKRKHLLILALPCTFPYEYIVKTETFTEDLDYVFGALRLPSKPRVVQNQIKSGRNKDKKDLRYYKEYPGYQKANLRHFQNRLRDVWIRVAAEFSQGTLSVKLFKLRT
nr:uncharacterized protein LOC113817920 [Penaeus vannamei]